MDGKKFVHRHRHWHCVGVIFVRARKIFSIHFHKVYLHRHRVVLVKCVFCRDCTYAVHSVLCLVKRAHFMFMFAANTTRIMFRNVDFKCTQKLVQLGAGCQFYAMQCNVCYSTLCVSNRGSAGAQEAWKVETKLQQRTESKQSKGFC